MVEGALMKAWFRTANLAALLVLAAGGSSAQAPPEDIVVDCNIFFQNTPNCPTGESPAGCSTGPYTTCQLVQTIFPHNMLGVDPEFHGDPLATPPNFRVLAGGNSTQLGGANVGLPPNDGFFTQTYFVGGMGVGADEDWTAGWTYWSPNGAGRTDLPAGPPVIVVGNIVANTHWTNNGLGYLLQGTVRVIPPAVLTIDAGTVVFGENASIGTLIIEQGAKIMATGTAQQPIIMTSDALPGSQDRGQWGGLVINGLAPVNCAAVPGGTCQGEGGSGVYGGSDENDNSGTLQYVRLEYPGREFSPDNELNALTLNGVGRGTTIHHVQTHRGFDDGIEMFGGTVDMKFAVTDECGDDLFDWQVGWRGRAQFVVGRQACGPLALDKGIEADNYEFGFDNGPRSNPKVFNMTLVGAGTGCAVASRGVHLRRGTAGTFANSVIYNFKTQGIDLEHTETFNNCPGTPLALLQIGVNDQGAPSLPMAVNQHPNPFNPSTQIDFTNPTTGWVRVRIFDAAGRLVDNLVNEHLASGSHSFQWNAPADAGSGAYFYRVEAGGQVVNGKMQLVK
jgi:hypothetical protein